MIKTQLFVDEDKINNDDILFLNDSYSLNIARVLRLKPNDKIEIFTKKNERFLSTIISFSVKKMELRIQNKVDITPPKLNISLIQGIAKANKMDFLIQKATELNTNRIMPFISDKSKVSIKDTNKKMKRWERIIVESMRQCRRQTFPELCKPKSLEDFLADEKKQEFDLKIILEPTAPNHFKEHLLPNIKQISIIIGPEEGLSDTELKIADDFGYTRVKISPNILRVETALIGILMLIEGMA